MRKLIIAAFAVAALTAQASAYDPTGWHLPSYQPGDEGQHSAAYDAVHGHVAVHHHSVPAPPHVLTARQNAYILCVTGREPADFDFDGTCHQITKNNQNSSTGPDGRGRLVEFTDKNGYHFRYVVGVNGITESKGGITWTFEHDAGGHYHLTNTCTGWFC